MKLTRKQANEFVENPDNWEIVPGYNEYVRAAKMEFKGVTYVRIDTPSVANYLEAVIEKTEPIRMEFRPSEYRKMMKYGVYAVSKTEIANEIYDLAKEDS